METAYSPEETKSFYKADRFRRRRKLVDSTPSPVWKRWYAAQAFVLLEADSKLDKVEPPKLHTTKSTTESPSSPTEIRAQFSRKFHRQGRQLER